MNAEDAIGGPDADWFDVLVEINQRWLSSYARAHPAFGVSQSLLGRNSLWMNAFFQKQRMITPAVSRQAKVLLQQHQEIIVQRLRASRGTGGPPLGPEFSTAVVEPMVALMFATTADRCPEFQIENLLVETVELLQCSSLRKLANRSGLAGCIFRFLTMYTESSKRILCLRVLLMLSRDDAAAVVQSCKIAAQGQLWQPNMFIYTLHKRHYDNPTICELAEELLGYFSREMPISSPVKLEQRRQDFAEPTPPAIGHAGRKELKTSPRPGNSRSGVLPSIVTPPKVEPLQLHRPVTTISSLYVDAPSPYSKSLCLPLTYSPPRQAEQLRRALIFSTPKEKAVKGDRRRRCLTPNLAEEKRDRPPADDMDWLAPTESENNKRLGSPQSPKKVITPSDKYSWNPECINSVSGFEWWWRSLPQHHASLQPTQKLKMVTKAAVRLHTKGEWERATELYLLALSMEVDDEVKFRLRVNLACAYEFGAEYEASAAEFRAALDINPDDSFARYKLGAVLKAMESYDAAKTELEAVCDVYPPAQQALIELVSAQEQKRLDADAHRKALAAARQPRSPGKAGRSLQQKCYFASTQADESIARKTLAPMSPRPTKSDPIDRSQRDRTSFPDEDKVPSTPQTPSRLTSRQDLIAAVASRTKESALDLEWAFRTVDVSADGHVQTEIFARVLGKFCSMDANAIEQVLKNDPTIVNSQNSVTYASFLDECQVGCGRSGAERPRQWEEFLISLRQQQVPACLIARCPPSAESSGDEPNSAVVDVDEFAHKTDVVVPNPAPAVDSRENVRDDGTMSLLLAATEPGEAAPSPAVRRCEKRETARREAILRAERHRVVARKHLFSLKALREVAVRARRHLHVQRVARAFAQEVEAAALESLVTARHGANRSPDDAPSGPPPLACPVETTAAPTAAPERGPPAAAIATSRHQDAVPRELAGAVYDHAVARALDRLQVTGELAIIAALAQHWATLHCRVPCRAPTAGVDDTVGTEATSSGS